MASLENALKAAIALYSVTAASDLPGHLVRRVSLRPVLLSHAWKTTSIARDLARSKSPMTPTSPRSFFLTERVAASEQNRCPAYRLCLSSAICTLEAFRILPLS